MNITSYFYSKRGKLKTVLIFVKVFDTLQTHLRAT